MRGFLNNRKWFKRNTAGVQKITRRPLDFLELMLRVINSVNSSFKNTSNALPVKRAKHFFESEMPATTPMVREN